VDGEDALEEGESVVGGGGGGDGGGGGRGARAKGAEGAASSAEMIIPKDLWDKVLSLREKHEAAAVRWQLALSRWDPELKSRACQQRPPASAAGLAAGSHAATRLTSYAMPAGIAVEGSTAAFPHQARPSSSSSSSQLCHPAAVAVVRGHRIPVRQPADMPAGGDAEGACSGEAQEPAKGDCSAPPSPPQSQGMQAEGATSASPETLLHDLQRLAMDSAGAPDLRGVSRTRGVASRAALVPPLIIPLPAATEESPRESQDGEHAPPYTYISTGGKGAEDEGKGAGGGNCRDGGGGLTSRSAHRCLGATLIPKP